MGGVRELLLYCFPPPGSYCTFLHTPLKSSFRYAINLAPRQNKNPNDNTFRCKSSSLYSSHGKRGSCGQTRNKHGRGRSRWARRMVILLIKSGRLIKIGFPRPFVVACPCRLSLAGMAWQLQLHSSSCQSSRISLCSSLPPLLYIVRELSTTHYAGEALTGLSGVTNVCVYVRPSLRCNVGVSVGPRWQCEMVLLVVAIERSCEIIAAFSWMNSLLQLNAGTESFGHKATITATPIIMPCSPLTTRNQCGDHPPRHINVWMWVT